MYVCICHAITDGDIQTAKGQGSQTHRDVFQHYGVKPQCGRCVKCLKGMMTDGANQIGRCSANR